MSAQLAVPSEGPGGGPRAGGRAPLVRPWGAPAPTLLQLRVSRPGACSPGLGALLARELPRAPRAPVPEAASRPGRGRRELRWVGSRPSRRSLPPGHPGTSRARRGVRAKASGGSWSLEEEWPQAGRRRPEVSALWGGGVWCLRRGRRGCADGGSPGGADAGDPPR